MGSGPSTNKVLSDLRFQALLRPENRASSRMVVDRPVTLRPEDNQAIDAVIDSLSQTGFGMLTTADLAVGSIVGLSVAGAFRRRVRIIRRSGHSYGCEFLSPLSDLEVSAALRSGEIVSADFVADRDQATRKARMFPKVQRKPSFLTRVYILAVLLIILWSVPILLLWRLL